MSYLIAYLHPGEVAHTFMRSCVETMAGDVRGRQEFRGFIIEECGASRIADGRNSAVQKFLQTDGDWLVFIDADMGFDGDAVQRLLDSADPEERPIMGGLCFAHKRGPDGPSGSRKLRALPTLYRWVETDLTAGVTPIYDYPRDSVVEVDGTGAAFIAIHRRVFETVGEAFAGSVRRWFDETEFKGQVFSEDLTFCRRATASGFPVHVNTAVKTSHYKPHYLEESTVGDMTSAPTFVVVPVKDHTDLTEQLAADLVRDREYASILLFDNGSTRKERARLDALAAATPGCHVLDADGANIHQMWNAGLEIANRASWPVNVAILNNDIRLGPGALSTMATALRDDPLLAAVCPNYDGRDGDGVVYVDDVAAGKMDGTGGLAGFCFMLRGEAGYRFPEQLSWYWGDADMVLTLHAAGSKAGIVLDATCEHVNGGSQTGRWDTPAMREVLRRDRTEFARKWGVSPKRIAA